MRSGAGALVGGLHTVHTAAVHGTEAAAGGEALAFVGRHAASVAARTEATVARVAALRAPAPRQAFADVLSLVALAGDGLATAALYCAIERMVQLCLQQGGGAEVWQRLTAQASRATLPCRGPHLLCCAVSCCAVLCCAVLCCAVLHANGAAA